MRTPSLSDYMGYGVCVREVLEYDGLTRHARKPRRSSKADLPATIGAAASIIECGILGPAPAWSKATHCCERSSAL